jgi:hypothetical protein
MLVLLGLLEDLLEDGAPERVESRDRKIEDPALGNVGRLGVHHVPDVANLQIKASLLS